MLARNKQEFISYFKEIEDPRQDEKLLYPLHEVLFLIIFGVLGCAEDWDTILDFGKHKLHVLRKYFPYEHGLPSISTLMRVVGLVDKSQMESWLKKQSSIIIESLNNELVILDGKSLRGKRKFENKNKNSHILNVFASNLGLVYCQKSIPDKSSELTAIREILDESNIDGATISIDATGCQKDIAEKVIDKKIISFHLKAIKVLFCLMWIQCLSQAYINQIFIVKMIKLMEE